MGEKAPKLAKNRAKELWLRETDGDLHRLDMAFLLYMTKFKAFHFPRSVI